MAAEQKNDNPAKTLFVGTGGCPCYVFCDKDSNDTPTKKSVTLTVVVMHKPSLDAVLEVERERWGSDPRLKSVMISDYQCVRPSNPGMYLHVTVKYLS